MIIWTMWLSPCHFIRKKYNLQQEIRNLSNSNMEILSSNHKIKRLYNSRIAHYKNFLRSKQYHRSINLNELKRKNNVKHFRCVFDAHFLLNSQRRWTVPLLYAHVTFFIPPWLSFIPWLFFYFFSHARIYPTVGVRKKWESRVRFERLSLVGTWGGMRNIDPSFIRGWCEFQHKRVGGGGGDENIYYREKSITVSRCHCDTGI